MTFHRDLEDIAVALRKSLNDDKKYILIYAYNGTGKTRLSSQFKDIGKKEVYEARLSQICDAISSENHSGEEKLILVNSLNEILFEGKRKKLDIGDLEKIKTNISKAIPEKYAGNYDELSDFSDELIFKTKEHGINLEMPNVAMGDTLYFNAFTEDLFYWDNDLEGDSNRVLNLNTDSRFFSGIEEFEMDTRIRPLLQRYADFDFVIEDKLNKRGEIVKDNNGNNIKVVNFTRTIPNENYDENADDAENERNILVKNIKVSRGEENIFIWCFFLAVATLAIDEAEAYKWVKYIYVDDPISSLDENNAIKVAHHLSKLLTQDKSKVKAVISSHHPLFFNVMWNELNVEKGKFAPYFLSKIYDEFEFELGNLFKKLNAEKFTADDKEKLLSIIVEKFPTVNNQLDLFSDKKKLRDFFLVNYERASNSIDKFLKDLLPKLDKKHFLKKYKVDGGKYELRYTKDTPFFHHVATLVQLKQAVESGNLYTHHFNLLRAILEKTASFHGFGKFSSLIALEEEDPDGALHSRLVNVLNHGNYSLYAPTPMGLETKDDFDKILSALMKNYTFNPELFI